MREIAPKLWVGSQADFAELDQFGTEWAIVHACKDPHHRAMVGYSGRGAPADHPERLVATRGKRMALNLIDADDPKLVPREVVDAALRHIRTSLANGEYILVHCNQGQSRAPTIAMLHLAPTLPESFDEAETAFRRLCPEYAPAKGMRSFASANWVAYRGGTSRLTVDNSIVTRLRRYQERTAATQLIQDAIDEIERLRRYRDLIESITAGSRAEDDLMRSRTTDALI